MNAKRNKTTSKAEPKFTSRLVGELVVDTGHIVLGDVDAQLNLPTQTGDGVYAVYAERVDGELVGYYIDLER